MEYNEFDEMPKMG